MPDKIQLDIDIINMRFGYLDTDTVSDIEYPDSDTDRLNPSKRIRSRIRSENIRTIFIPDNDSLDGYAWSLHDHMDALIIALGHPIVTIPCHHAICTRGPAPTCAE
jgi:hypothetical protein